jgi:hypothetical protein
MVVTAVFHAIYKASLSVLKSMICGINPGAVSESNAVLIRISIGTPEETLSKIWMVTNQLPGIMRGSGLSARSCRLKPAPTGPHLDLFSKDSLTRLLAHSMAHESDIVGASGRPYKIAIFETGLCFPDFPRHGIRVVERNHIRIRPENPLRH